MTEYNNVTSTELSTSPERNSFPFELTTENIDRAIDELSSEMIIDQEMLTQDPKENWESIQDYLKCVKFSPDSENFTILGTEIDSIPEVEDLKISEGMDRKSKVSLLLTTEAMLNTAIGGLENGEDYNLKMLIDDIHPDWKRQLDSYRKDIRSIIDEANRSEDNKSSLFEDVSKALKFTNNNKRKVYNTLAIIALSAGLLSSCNEIEAIGSYNTEPFVDEPKATSTYTPAEPTQTPTPEPTMTETVEPTFTPTPTEEFYSSEYYTGQEELDKFGYVVWHAEKTEPPQFGWVIMSYFTYEKYSVTDQEVYIHGTYRFDGKDYQIKFMADLNDLYHIKGPRLYPLEDIESIEERYKKDKDYIFFAFPTNKDTNKIIPYSPDQNTNEGWKEFRELFHDILVNGGENDSHYLLLEHIQDIP